MTDIWLALGTVAALTILGVALADLHNDLRFIAHADKRRAAHAERN